MYFITIKRMLEVCFSAHPNIQYRAFIWCHRAKPVTEENRRFFEESKANRWENGSKSPENQGFSGFFYA